MNETSPKPTEEASTAQRLSRDMTIGTSFALFQCALLSPLDRAKVIITLNDGPPYNGFMDCVRRSTKELGILTWWVNVPSVYCAQFCVRHGFLLAINDSCYYHFRQ